MCKNEHKKLVYLSMARTCLAYLADLMAYKLKNEGILPIKEKEPER